MNVYESDRLLAEYLLFHYGRPEEILPWRDGPHGALGFAQRVVSEMFAPLPEEGRALDIGCAVGRSTFELARACGEVIGIDYSRRFIEAAEQLRAAGEIVSPRVDEGVCATLLTLQVPDYRCGIEPERVAFEVGNAESLRSGLGSFDAVLAANLLCRLPSPQRFLAQLPSLVKPGGQLVLTTPSTWMEDYTPRAHWLGGIEREGVCQTTLEGLHAVLDADFELEKTLDLPFLIREHGRKYQWSVAQGTRWRRRQA